MAELVTHCGVRVLQELYRAVPVLLAPVLGNPLALASYGIDPTASIPDKVRAVTELALSRLLTQLCCG